jgi:uncharacterized protein
VSSRTDYQLGQARVKNPVFEAAQGFFNQQKHAAECMICFLKEAVVEAGSEAPAHEKPRDGESVAGHEDENRTYGPEVIFKGDDGLRAGWAIAIFIALFRLFNIIAGTLVIGFYPPAGSGRFEPGPALANELCPFLALLGAAAIVALLDQRSLLEFNLSGPQKTRRFFTGLGSGFVALSALVGAMALGGWLQFGPMTLSGISLARYAALWGCAFLLVGCVEEGIFRGFLQSTLTRGVNFWWALALVLAICGDLWMRSHGQAGVVSVLWLQPLGPATGDGVWGVYAVAALGLAPCAWLHVRRVNGSAFWQAAWITSTLFGFVHTGNHGENWIGILAAASIGFLFCVSVRLTGSVWWAIGCHAAWDWAETFFYGTADSGFTARGHLLTTTPAGNALWSGGTDGPEGSLLVLGAIALLLGLLVALYGRKREIQS